MRKTNPVIWSEGLLLKPQHFQQQQRHIEAVIDNKFNATHNYLYGVMELSLNIDLLSVGKISLDKVSGILPDGTVFNLPEHDNLPVPLDLTSATVAQQVVYLSLPLQNLRTSEVSWSSKSELSYDHAVRYRAKLHKMVDIHSEHSQDADILLAAGQYRLLLEQDDRRGYICLPIAKILEKRPNGSLLLDQDFIACHLNSLLITRLVNFMQELLQAISARAQMLANRMSKNLQADAAELTDLVMLQTFNRLKPQLEYWLSLKTLHPKELYQYLIGICGELATFSSKTKLAETYPIYDHNLPHISFTLIINKLRSILSVIIEPRALAVTIEKHQYGLMVAPITDLFKSDTNFILAIKAQMPLDELQKLFMAQAKIAPVEKIRDLISLQLSGINLLNLPVAPRELPYHAGYIYFQLDRQSELWSALKNSTGLAFHVSGSFSQLELKLWAIRST